MRIPKLDTDMEFDWVSAALGLERSRSTQLRDLARAAALDASAGDLAAIDLSGLDLRNQDLSGLDLRFANFSRCELAKADLRGAQLDASALVKANEWERAILDDSIRRESDEICQSFYTKEIFEVRIDISQQERKALQLISNLSWIRENILISLLCMSGLEEAFSTKQESITFLAAESRPRRTRIPAYVQTIISYALLSLYRRHPKDMYEFRFRIEVGFNVALSRLNSINSAFPLSKMGSQDGEKIFARMFPEITLPSNLPFHSFSYWLPILLRHFADKVRASNGFGSRFKFSRAMKTVVGETKNLP